MYGVCLGVCVDHATTYSDVCTTYTHTCLYGQYLPLPFQVTSQLVFEATY